MTDVIPKTLAWTVLLEALSPISHHDAAIHDDSNRLLFNRQRQLLPMDADGRAASAQDLAAIAEYNGVPVDLIDLFEGLSAAEFVAVALTRRFIDLYGRGDGSGLFEGLGRYEMLESRMRHAAVSSPTLRSYWDRLCDTLRVAISGGREDKELLRLLAVAPGLQQSVLRAIEDGYRSIVMLARTWATEVKMQSEEYAEAAGKEAAARGLAVLTLKPPPQRTPEDTVIADVPTISANTLRHVMVREPSWRHLVRALRLTPAKPGEGLLPPGVEALFYNGGSIKAGSKQLSGGWALAHEVRRRYPSLDLLGGVTDAFDLGTSRLRVGAWLVCAENRPAIESSADAAGDLANLKVSVFDMLDDVTLTRQASEQGEGQMIYSFETLCPGTQVLVRLALDPFSPGLTVGSLVAALEEYVESNPGVGGQGARGFGWVRATVLKGPPDIESNLSRDAYESYLGEHVATLRQGMEDGTLGTGKAVLS